MLLEVGLSKKKKEEEEEEEEKKRKSKLLGYPNSYFYNKRYVALMAVFIIFLII